jgi:UDP-N-acetylmuramyl pentapeptide phosphotransferase/UDP-N-acetylglucosamine-1-phosphate transferase
VSFVDDVVGIAVSLRLCVHVLAALVLIVGGFVLEEISVAGFDFHLSATLGILISALFIVWMINLYNFMDGMDGFAGGMAVIGFGTLGVLGMRAGDIHFALFSWLIAASAAGFLIWNFPPARIFLGDTGASVLGLLAAGLGLWGNDSGIFPIWIALLVFSPFIMDATVTLLRRLLRREAVWKAHREHYYQRLVMRGWGHKKTVLLEFAVMIGAALTAIFSVGATPLQQICALIVWTAVYFFGFVTVDLLIAPRVASCHPCSSGFEDKG